MYRQTLEEEFGYDGFKSEIQKQVTEAIYEGNRDVFVCMPAGSGKSLAFQLAALMEENQIAIVIVPHLALIKSQTDFLMSKGIEARSINSTTPYDERDRIRNDLHSNKPFTKFLYVTPEMCEQPHFRGTSTNLGENYKISYLVIVEAHWVYELKHVFRSSYRNLGAFRKLLPEVPVVALTTSATEEMRKDILTSLHMKRPLVFSVPVFRQNLYYDVHFTDIEQNILDHLQIFIDEALGPDVSKGDKRSCGIIYCRTADMADAIAEDLTERGIETLAYHNEMSYDDRIEAQKRWTFGKVPVIAATLCFGVGADKGSVRFVVHLTVPKSVAQYHCESGRAGRDGKPAFCRIYVSDAELRTVSNIINSAAHPDFERMKSYCLQARCRHAQFAEFFGDSQPLCIKSCDVCKDTTAVQWQIDTYQKFTSEKMQRFVKEFLNWET